ncbi:MAG: ECF transporter S component [Calditrichaeota bacterium]|nr:MAG: ECF transporter S component [Calditrichota bacterium]
MNQSKRQKLVLAGILAALCVATGYLFLLIPNVEMITATVFLSGVIVGPLWGAAVGFVSESLFSLLNPYGAPATPLFMAQVLSFSVIGLTGGLLAKSFIRLSWVKLILLGACGLLLTLFYDLLTTLSFGLFMSGSDLKKLLPIFTAGILFYLTHSLSNLIIFVTIIPMLLAGLKHYQNIRDPRA